MNNESRYKVVYKSGKEYIVVSDLINLDFIRQEKNGSQPVDKIYVESSTQNGVWDQIYPERYTY